MINEIPILMAEDDREDQLIVRKAMREAQLSNLLICVNNGEELLDYLHRRPPFNDDVKYPFPRLILLDMNMPGKDGRQALKEIRESPAFGHIPVVVLSTSSEEEEIWRGYKLGANSYICKPFSFDKMVSIMRSIGSYWFNLVEAPDDEK